MDNRRDEQTLRGAEGYDFRAHDRVWQRVAPSLDPFPGLRTAAVTPAAAAPTAPQRSRIPDFMLPGAEENPCCLGSEAAESLEVLEGFLRAECANRRYERALAVRACGGESRRALWQLSYGAEELIRRLRVILYLIAGREDECPGEREELCLPPYREALRSRYHAEICGAMNYIRAAEGTVDPCLQRLLQTMGEEKYERADKIMTLLEKELGGTCTAGRNRL